METEALSVEQVPQILCWTIAIDSLGWVLWYFARDSLRTWRWPNEVEENSSDTENQNEDTPDRRPDLLAHDPDMDHRNAEERQHRRREERYWACSIVFSGIAMVGAIVAAVAAVQSLGASRKAVKKAGEQVIEAQKQTGFARDAVEQYKIQAGAAKDSIVYAKIQADAAIRQADAATRSYIFVTIVDNNCSLIGWSFEEDGNPAPGVRCQNRSADSMINVALSLSNHGAGPALITKATCEIV